MRTTHKGNRASFEYSPDGESFTRFGPEFTLQFGRWTGDRLGFFCWNDKASGDRPMGHMDVDWFRYDYDGPKAAKK
jgi:hypothetical protein